MTGGRFAAMLVLWALVWTVVLLAVALLRDQPDYHCIEGGQIVRTVADPADCMSTPEQKGQ